MTHFRDLYACTYFSNWLDGPELLAVGWLEAGHDYAMGDPGVEVYNRLRAFQEGEWQPVSFLGAHECTLCRYDGAKSHRNILVPGRGVTYVAPEGICHYVGCHGYLPPSEFCEALMASPPVGSPEYFAALHANGWSRTVARPKVESPGTRRELAIEEVLDARCNALVVAIESYRELHGRLPDDLDDATSLVHDAGIWKYEIDGSHYVLRADCEAAGADLKYQSKFKTVTWLIRTRRAGPIDARGDLPEDA
jgi:hypothetical protein